MSLHNSMRIVPSLMVLMALGLTAGCLERTASTVPQDTSRPSDEANDTGKERLKEITPEIRAMVNADSDFALDLYARLAADKPGENLFFSPYSLSSALTMAAEGARGQTAEEMGKVLRYPASARREGAGASTLPWDMERIHTALAALNDHFTSGSRSAPRDVREKLDALWHELKSENARVAELRKKGKWQESETVARKTQRLAGEINKLQALYNQYELRIANALWGEKSYAFKQSYFDVLNKHYHTGGFFPVDFRNDFESARQRINAWVEERTHHRIKDMLPPNALDDRARKLVRLILTNAIYFKGEWAEVFEESQTKEDDFLLPAGRKTRVPMMGHRGMESARYAAFRGDGTLFDTPQQIALGENDAQRLYPDERGFQMLELPYKGGEVSMVLLVPRSADGLAALEKKLNRGELQSWIGKMMKRDVHVFLPKFKLETKYAMEHTLQQMGMVRAFVNPRAANGAQFDGMSESSDPEQKLYISKVLHKAFVEVNEKGTEAAAATAVMMAAGAAAPVMVAFTPVFKADRPFVFLIRDVKTGSILFLGRMMNPKQS